MNPPTGSGPSLLLAVRITFALLVFVVVFSACGGSDRSGDGDSDGAGATTSAMFDRDQTGSFDSGDLASTTTGPPCRDDRNWTRRANSSSDYVDFVQLPGGQFVNTEQNAGVLDQPDLGSIVAEVCLELSEVAFAGAFDIEIGDAAYLEPGTKIREIVGADPALRLGAVVGGRVLIYELANPLDAVVGGQVIDLGSNVDEVTVNRADGETVLASIAEPAAVDALVAAVRTAPVDRSPRPEPVVGEPGYLLEFRRSDGTTTRRRYGPKTGELASIIVVPEDVRLRLAGMIAWADPDVLTDGAAAAATTTTTSSATSSAESGQETDPAANGIGLIPEPRNEAESTLRFDFGAIVGTATEGDVTWIQFDRYQMANGMNGPDLIEEVRIEGATDLVWANENSRFRWYRLAADVEVLELEADWFNRLCDGEPAAAGFGPSSLNRLLALDARLVSMTIVEREVVRIRDQRSC